MSLFEKFNRTSTYKSNGLESSYEFYNKISGARGNHIRESPTLQTL